MELERRFLPVNVKVEKREDDIPIIVGYGAVYYDPADAGTEYKMWSDLWERIMPGAFDRAIREDDVRGLFNHDPNAILGRTTAKTMGLSTDKRGLRYEIEPGESTISRDVMAHIKRGDVTGSSFSFQVTEQRWVDQRKEDGGLISIREIVAVKLYDVGPVTFPAYDATTAGTRDARSIAMAGRPVIEPPKIEPKYDQRQYYRDRLRLAQISL